MKNYIVLGLAACTLFLASCTVGVGVGYGHDHRWHHGYHRYDSMATVVTPVEQSQMLSTDYSIRAESAAKVIALVNSKHPQAELAAMNLEMKDVAPLANLRMPSDESVQKIAAALNENSDVTARMMQDYIADMQAENVQN